MRLFCLTALLCITGLSSAQTSPEDSLKKRIVEAIDEGNELFIDQMCDDPSFVQGIQLVPKEQNALHRAASKHQADLIHILVSKCGFDPSETDVSETSALYYARMNPSTVRVLLELGADPNQVIKKSPAPVISQFLLNIVPRASLDAFLDYDVDLTKKSANGMTPLMYAVLSQQKSNVDFLMEAMEKGYDLAPHEKVGDDPKTAAELATPRIAALLAEHGIE